MRFAGSVETCPAGPADHRLAVCLVQSLGVTSIRQPVDSEQGCIDALEVEYQTNPLPVCESGFSSGALLGTRRGAGYEEASHG